MIWDNGSILKSRNSSLGAAVDLASLSGSSQVSGPLLVYIPAVATQQDVAASSECAKILLDFIGFLGLRINPPGFF